MKKLISIFVVVAMLATMIIAAIPASAADPTGTPINNADDFAAMVDGGEYYLAGSFTLPSGWAGKSISNVTLDGNGQTITLTGTKGLFSSVAGSTIKNLKLATATTDATLSYGLVDVATGNVTFEGIEIGKIKVSGTTMAGALLNSIDDSTADIVITNVTSLANVHGKEGGAGIVGRAYVKSATLTNVVNGAYGIETEVTNDKKNDNDYGAAGIMCDVDGNVTMNTVTNYAAVKANKGSRGGIIANYGKSGNNLSFTKVINYGDVTGTSGWPTGAAGMVGATEDSGIVLYFAECINYGNITGSGQTNKAGFIGYARGDYAVTSATFIKCENHGDVSTIGGNNVAGFTGQFSAGKFIFTDCINTGDITSAQLNAAGFMASAGGVTTFKNCENSGTIISNNQKQWRVTHPGSSSNPENNGSAAGFVTGNGSAKTFINCENSGDVISYNAAAGFVTSAGGGALKFHCCQDHADGNTSACEDADGCANGGANVNSGNITSYGFKKTYCAEGAGCVICDSKLGLHGEVHYKMNAAGFVVKYEGSVVAVNMINSGSVTGAGKTGAIFSEATKAVTGTNWTNTGAITSTGGFAGGLIAYATSNITLNNALNNANVTSNVHSAGGFIGQYNGGGTLTINNSANGSATAIDGITISGGGSGWDNNGGPSNGGIIGYGIGTIKLNNVNNYAKVDPLTGTPAGGIIGMVNNTGATTLDFDYVNNYGSVIADNGGGEEGIGGFIGNTKWSTPFVATFNDCANYGDVIAKTNVGGFIGNSPRGDITFENCVNAGDISTTSGKAAGILGNIPDSAKVTIKNSVSIGDIVVSTSGTAAGIIASKGSGAVTVNNSVSFAKISAASGVTVNALAPAAATSTNNVVIGVDDSDTAIAKINSYTGGVYTPALKSNLSVTAVANGSEFEANAVIAQRIDELITKQTALESALANKADTATLNQMVTEFQTAINAANTAIQGVDNDLQAYKSAQKLIDDAQTLAINTAKTNIEAAQAEINNIKTEIQNLKDKDTAIEGTIATLRNDFETAKTNLQNAINALETAMTAAEARLDQLEIDVDALEDDLAKAKQDLADLDQYVKDLEEELKTDIADLKAELDKAIADLEALIGDNLEASTDVLSLALAKLDALINETYELLENADEENKKELEAALAAAELTVTSVIEGLMEDLDEAMSDLEFAIESGDAILDAKIAVLNNALENAEAALKIADAESYAAIVTKMKKADETLDAAIKALQKKLGEAKAAFDAKDAELDVKDAELVAKDGKIQTFIIVVCVLACISLAGSGAFVAWFFIDKKKA